MKKSTFLRYCRSAIILLLLSMVLGSPPVKAQEHFPGSIDVESSITVAEIPTLEAPVLFDSPPALTQEQIAQLDWAEDNTGGSPVLDTTWAGEVAGPVPGIETPVDEKQTSLVTPLSPGSPEMYMMTQFGNVIPGGYKSNMMGSSTAGKGMKMFFTGNSFAANSVDKGQTWKYISAFSGFSAFCCNQIILYDDSRDMYIWLRQGNADINGVNEFKLSVDINDPFSTSYMTYSFTPIYVNGDWTNQRWDSPHMQLGADYLYISWNLYINTGAWTRSVMLRFPLDSLAAGAGFSYNYVHTADWFTFVPVSGASHTMYFASNWDTSAPYDSLGIWRWHEDSGSLNFWIKTVPAWTATGPGSMHCGTPNWLSRGDMRLLTGARYEIHSNGFADPRQTGKKVLGWWWNVAEGGGFSYPYINGAAFYEDTMELLPGYLGRPYIYGSWCFAYPSFTPNSRGDLGGVFNFSTSPDYHKPRVAYTIADDFVTAPPGWPVYEVTSSSAGPSDAKWGNYNTARNYQSGTTWIAASHYIINASNCSNCAVPLWMAFGRERDEKDFKNTCQLYGTCLPFLVR